MRDGGRRDYHGSLVEKSKQDPYYDDDPYYTRPHGYYSDEDTQQYKSGYKGYSKNRKYDDYDQGYGQKQQYRKTYHDQYANNNFGSYKRNQ